MKAGVGVSAEDHVTCITTCGAMVRVCGQVAEKFVHGNIGGFSGGGLLGTQGTEGGKELVVDCTCIVEESTNDALNSLGCRDRHGLVGWFGQK